MKCQNTKNLCFRRSMHTWVSKEISLISLDDIATAQGRHIRTCYLIKDMAEMKQRDLATIHQRLHPDDLFHLIFLQESFTSLNRERFVLPCEIRRFRGIFRRRPPAMFDSILIGGKGYL